MRNRLIQILILIIPLSTLLVEAQDNFEIESLSQLVSTGDQDTNLVKNYIKLSEAYLNVNYDSSLLYALTANKIAFAINDKMGQANSYVSIAKSYNYKSNYDSSKLAYEKAYSIFKELKKYRDMGFVFHYMGSMEQNSENYEKATSNFMKALRLIKKHGTAKDLARVYQNLGNVFAIQGELETSEKYMTASIKKYEESGDSVRYYTGLINLSSLYKDQNKLELAEECLRKSLRYQRTTGDKIRIGVCLFNLGQLNELKGYYDSAILNWQQAKAIFIDLGNTRRVIGCHLKLANIYILKKEWKIAKNEAKAGLQQAKEINTAIQIYRLHQMLSEIYFSSSDYKRAYEHLEQSAAIKDSIANEEHNVKIVEIEKKYTSEIDKRRIAELEVVNSSSNIKARQKENENYVLIGIIIIILIIAAALYNQIRTKRKVSDTLKEKNDLVQRSLDEKEVLLREIHHRVQNNLQFVSSLLNIQSRRISDENTLNVLRECKLRIQAMALIHRKLYQENSLNGIDIKQYCINLLESLMKSYQVEIKNIETVIDVEELLLDINSAIPIGLILNELITNSFKYAFGQDTIGKLELRLMEIDSCLHLEVSDNGKGLGPDFSLEASSTFGLKLVKSLAYKLKGDIKVDNSNGTSVKIIIHRYEKIRSNN